MNPFSKIWGYVAGFAMAALAAWSAYREIKQSGKDEQELEQRKNASNVQAKERLLKDETIKINETIAGRDKSKRSGLLHYAAAPSDKPRDAGKEDSSDS